MKDIEAYPIEDILDELKRRNISFVFGYVDHNQLACDGDASNHWSVDGKGNTVLLSALGDLIDRWMNKILDDDTEYEKFFVDNEEDEDE